MGKDCEKDFTCQVRKDAKGLTEEVRDLDKKNRLSAENINKAMKYLKRAIDEMDQYENINNEKIAKKKADKAKKAEKERKERLAKEEKAKKEKLEKEKKEKEEKAKKEAKNGNKLNDGWNKFRAKINDVLTVARRDCNKRLIKDNMLLINLESIKTRIDHLSKVAVDEPALAKQLAVMVDDILARFRFFGGEIGTDDSMANKWLNIEWYNIAKDALKTLVEIQNIVDKREDNRLNNLKKLDNLNKLKRELNNLKRELKAKSDEFRARWDKHTEFRKQIGEYNKKNDPTYQDRQEAKNWCRKAFVSEKEQDMKKAIECCDKAINGMNKYESDKTSVDNLNEELDDLKQTVDDMLDATNKKRESYSKNDEDQVKFLILFSALESSQALLKEIRGIAVNDPDFANKIRDMIEDADLGIKKEYYGIWDEKHNRDISYLRFADDWFYQVPKMLEKLENVQKLMKENVKK
jgi:chromosome segregation ATPase